MLSRYEKIIEDYKTWYPNMYAQTTECRPSGHSQIMIVLKDGTRMEFNAIDNSIRNVTKYYEHDSDSALDEEAWRKEFGRKLSRAISDKGLTQERLSEMTGISRQMLSRYVRGSSTPSGYILSRLVEVLGCDARDLTKFGYIDEN